MPLKLQLTDKQEDLVEKGLRMSWVMGIGGVLLLIAFVFLLYKLTDTVAIGPQLEVLCRLNHEEEVVSFPIGAQISVGYGPNNRASFFLGYDTKEQRGALDSDRLAGRVTFVHLW